jgi:hypothetical protein
MHQAAATAAAEAEAEAEAAAARGGQTLLCRPSPPVCVWMQEGDGGREGGQRVAASAESRPLLCLVGQQQTDSSRERGEREEEDKEEEEERLDDESLKTDSDSCAAEERICTGNWLENAEFRSFEEFNFQVCVAAVPFYCRESVHEYELKCFRKF